MGRDEWLVLVDGGKRESTLDVCSTFERMEMNRDNVKSLNSKEISQTLSGLVAQFLTGLGAKPRIW